MMREIARCGKLSAAAPVWVRIPPAVQAVIDEQFARAAALAPGLAAGLGDGDAEWRWVRGHTGHAGNELAGRRLTEGNAAWFHARRDAGFTPASWGPAAFAAARAAAAAVVADLAGTHGPTAKHIAALARARNEAVGREGER